jgi:hypothetical protein
MRPSPLAAARTTGVFRSGQPFIENRLGFVAEPCNVCRELGGKIFIQFEFHLARIGTSRSS